MEPRACRVTITDIQGVAHTVEVTAGTLFEAVAMGITALRADGWTGDLAQRDVVVSVQSVAVEHRVKMNEFYQWVERSIGSPAEKTRRRRVKEILGLQTQ
jgi:hypothetical protein